MEVDMTLQGEEVEVVILYICVVCTLSLRQVATFNKDFYETEDVVFELALNKIFCRVHTEIWWK